ncbi:MAG: hypothetical protein HGA96_04875 [Desulfobulbaceae bacterium]|nr:hypothetical protein [Desulfobulbaceae bacterium]
MSKYIFSAGEFPIFTPEQSRMGIFLGYFSGILINILGPSTFLIKILPTLVSLLYCLGVFLLAKKIGNLRFAWNALILSVFCPAFMTSYVVHGADQYITSMTLGVYLLILALHVSEEENALHRERHQKHHLSASAAACLLGLLAGLAFWIQPLSLTFIIPGLLLMFCTLPPRKLFPKIPWGICGSFLGLLPLIYFNLSSEARALNGLTGSPNWITFSFLNPTDNQSPGFFANLWALPDTLHNIITIAMPMLWGGFEWIFETSIIRKFSYTLVALVLAGGICNFLFQRFKATPFQKKFPFWRWDNNDIPLFSFVSLILIFGLSRFKSDVYEPRYLFPFYFSITLMVAWSLSEWEKKLKNSGKIPLLLLTISAVATTLLPSTTLDPDHTLWPRDRELAQYLIANNITHPVAGFWVAYPLAYESDEKIWPIPILLEKFHYFLHRKKWPPEIVDPYYIFPNNHYTKDLYDYIFPSEEAPYWDSADFSNYLQETGASNKYYQKYSFANYDLFRVSPEILNPSRFVTSPYYLRSSNRP